MQLIPRRMEAAVGSAEGDRSMSAVITGSTCVTRLGPLELTAALTQTGVEWSVANRGDDAVRVRGVALVFELVDVVVPLRMFRNGYQSWSPSAVATLGADVDPSAVADFEFLQATQHADQRRARDGELRSEWVTVLADAGSTGSEHPLLIGFDGGHRHDGTFRLRPNGGSVELWAEAHLGDALVEPGEERHLHRLVLDDGGEGDASSKLAGWATLVGSRNGARVRAPYRVGWCSWYQYFHDVTEEHLRTNLALAADWPFEVFQLDDGFQRAIGDWLTTNDKFPSGLDAIASSIAAAGRIPGLWLAPFLVAPDSEVATLHPEWIARNVVAGVDRGPLRTWWNPGWAGGEDGFMYGLDTTHPEAAAHLESVAAALVDAGFTYLKLDFTFSPSVDGGYADPSCTPAERVRAGFDAIRRGAGDDAFLLGCGVPLANVVGVVDANRIGPDVAPTWALEPSEEIIKGYLGMQPSTQHAFVNTLARAFMHRRLWLNDPDCLMLRTEDTHLTQAALRTWAHTVALSGGLALVSDDLALLDADARRLLDEVTALGRASDDDALLDNGACCPDLLDRCPPSQLVAAGWVLEAEPSAGASTLRRTTDHAG